MIANTKAPLDPDPSSWPVFVTGAGGFVGGHVARHLARCGHRVRGLARTRPTDNPGDPPIEWIIGDVREPAILRSAVAGIRGVIHTAAWVSLGRDRRGLSQSINVDATRELLDVARRAGVERFVYTSTLHTLAAGSREVPADEETPWNLESVDSPYCRTKREAETLVRQASSQSFTTIVLCPGMVLGERDPKPTSTKFIHTLARTPIAVVPDGGIPTVDTSVIAIAHRRALVSGEPGHRYAIVGDYASYAEVARTVGRINGWPWTVVIMPPLFKVPFKGVASLIERVSATKEISANTVAGGYLHMHVSGEKANTCFGLIHPPAIDSIRAALSKGLRDSATVRLA